MPELPEVEFARRQLLRWLAAHRLVAARAAPGRTFRGADVEAFEQLSGRLLEADRRGKYLLLTFERGRGLLAHLGMTGKFVRRPPGTAQPHSRATFQLADDSVIHFVDPRLFGRLQPLPADRLKADPVIAQLGLDPLVDGLDPARLRARLSGSRQPLKVALMDQSRVCGLGNIHAAEALYRARLHPARLPGTLTRAEWGALCRAIRATLQFALDSEDGEEIHYVEEPGSKNPFLVYGRAGERCRRCGRRVQSTVQGGRTTHYCPGCQRRRAIAVRGARHR